MGMPNLSAAAAAAANPTLLGLGPASAAALQLRLASAAGAVQQGMMDNQPGEKSENRRQRRYLMRSSSAPLGTSMLLVMSLQQTGLQPQPCLQQHSSSSNSAAIGSGGVCKRLSRQGPPCRINLGVSRSRLLKCCGVVWYRAQDAFQPRECAPLA